MKKVLLGTLAVLTLAACSKDEVIQQNPNDEITFSVVTNKAVSRAADGYCNKSLPGSFNVWARHKADGASVYTSYFKGEQYNKPTTGNTYTQNDGTKRYWPESGKLDFFALVNSQGTPTWKENPTGSEVALTVTNYQVETTPGAQKDFMYAVTTEQATKTATTLNFRHALSQIEFQAKNENSKIYVKVSGVKVMNVKDQGTFALPMASTATPYVGTPESGDKHTTLPSLGASETIENQGTWKSTSSTAQYIIATLKADATEITNETKVVVGVPKGDDPVSLTVTDPDKKEYNYNTLYVLPQKFGDGTGETTKLWNGTDALMETSTYKTGTGAYLILTCQIFNVAGANYVDGTDVAVWGTASEAKDIAVKLPNNEWEQGKRYVYTFTFTTAGNGGYDPKDNTPVLTPITLSVTVDDFVKGIDKDVEMTKP